ncbi:hypothetical protein FA09DRAFT_137593 [Tilletiopsis washingtonensis]|uniref:Uncharacterized protein n=1 Tax=Tilletiopsis washingtonensis TaxID=58919 RepID=A0A316Z2D9_9BASI|nr:hypothetical protein FA09DRAFT_137593 [Tilletiopsis washingtonensis]PWN95701.1 hypothetical protein FA09DRAFT_137593 [Tilletiopsis washingtonensis]
MTAAARAAAEIKSVAPHSDSASPNAVELGRPSSIQAAHSELDMLCRCWLPEASTQLALSRRSSLARSGRVPLARRSRRPRSAAPEQVSSRRRASLVVSSRFFVFAAWRSLVSSSAAALLAPASTLRSRGCQRAERLARGSGTSRAAARALFLIHPLARARLAGPAAA